MSFILSNNLVSNKMREQMYLKHLRQVERINNREADSLKKDLKYYRSISELHKNNKERSSKWQQSQILKNIEQKNLKIHSKISGMSSDEQIKQSKVKLNTNSITVSMEKKSPLNEHKKSLHYRYRKKQQEQIEEENSKLMKAILSQKSTLLPNIKKSRAFTSLQKSRQSEGEGDIQ